MSVGRVIVGDSCVAEGAVWLAGRDARFAAALEQTGPLPLRLREDGFAALLSAIVSQPRRRRSGGGWSPRGW